MLITAKSLVANPFLRPPGRWPSIPQPNQPTRTDRLKHFPTVLFSRSYGPVVIRDYYTLDEVKLAGGLPPGRHGLLGLIPQDMGLTFTDAGLFFFGGGLLLLT